MSSLTWYVCLGNTCIFQAIKDVRAGQGALVDLFGRIENSFQRLVVYSGVWPTTAMMDGIVKIMIEVLLILGILTKEAGQGRTSMSFLVNFPPKTHLVEGKFFKKLVGKKDVEDALQRLDKLTQEVARLAETEIQVLTVTRRNDNEMQVVDNRAEDFNSEVHEIGHSSKQGGSKPGHELPWGKGPTRDTDQSSLAPTFISSSSGGLYSDIVRRGGEYGPSELCTLGERLLRCLLATHPRFAYLNRTGTKSSIASSSRVPSTPVSAGEHGHCWSA